MRMRPDAPDTVFVWQVAVAPEAKERYGIAVEFLGIRKLGLPEPITQKVFQRMRAERGEIAERYRSEGEAEAIDVDTLVGDIVESVERSAAQSKEPFLR